jgi:hypothetical protein
VASTPEGKLKVALRKELTRQGIFHYIAAAGPYSIHGIPDIVCIWQGRALYVEVKAPGKRGHTTANQKRMLRQIADAGGIACVVDSIEQLQEILSEGPDQAPRDPLDFAGAG